MEEEKIKMQEWLKEEYGKEFVVKSIEHYTRSLGGDKEIKGMAYPVDDKELVFEVGKLESGEMWKMGDMLFEYNERYLWTLWEKQAKENMKDLMPKNNYSITMTFKPDDIIPSLKGKTMNLNEAKEKFKNKISMEIDCALFEEKMDSQLDTIFSIINAYKDTSYEQISLNVVYLDKTNKRDVEKEVEKYMYSGKSFYNVIKKINNIKVEYTINDINTINSVEEIKNYITKK